MSAALTLDKVQEVREAFAALARWSGLPVASLLKFADPMVGADGVLGVYACYTTSLRRFAIHPVDETTSLPWRVSLNSIGIMLNPTDLKPSESAELCYRFLLAHEAGELFEASFLDEPRLWPKTITRPDDLAEVRQAITDLRPTETVAYARQLLGTTRYVARLIPGTSWREWDWCTVDGRPVGPPSGQGGAVGSWLTWRVYLLGFLRHPVAFTLDTEGRRSEKTTRGMLSPAPIRITGATRTGRTDWAGGELAEELVPDPGEWARVLDGLAHVPGDELARAGLAPRTTRAMRSGRRPLRRNAEAARRLVAYRARAEAGLVRASGRRCIAPGCGECLRGRQRSFCTRHAAYPGSRRKAWKEAAR